MSQPMLPSNSTCSMDSMPSATVFTFKCLDRSIRHEIGHIEEKGAVQFQRVHIKLLQKSQGGKTRPEIVQGAQKTHAMHLLNGFSDCLNLLVVKENGLRQLEFQDFVSNSMTARYW